MPLEIFISHSARKDLEDSDDLVSDDDHAFLCDLATRIGDITDDAGNPIYSVIVDEDHVKAGESWRMKLIDGLGSCAAGIVLFNKKAIARSDWVFTEANIMRWRQYREDNFVLIPIALGPGSFAALDSDRKWEPLAFTEGQFLAGATEFTGASLAQTAFDELTSALPKPRQRRRPSAFERLEKALITQVKRTIPDDYKDNAAEDARRLMSAGLAGMDDLKLDYDNGLNAGEWMHLCEELACWWVDPAAALRLANCTDGSAQSYGLSAKHPGFTPRQYVRQACFTSVQWSWKVADEITAASANQTGAAFYDAVVDEVRQNLLKVFQKAWRKNKNAVTDDDIRDLINYNLHKPNPEPTFVVLPPNVAASPAVKNAILAAFPKVQFLHIAENESSALALPDCTLLEPLLKPDLESAEYWAYTSARGALNVIGAEI